MPYAYVDTPLEVLLANPNSVNFGNGYVPYVIDDAAVAAAISVGTDPNAALQAQDRSIKAVNYAQSQGLPVYTPTPTPVPAIPPQVITPTPTFTPAPVTLTPSVVDPDAVSLYTKTDINQLITLLTGLNVGLAGGTPEFSNYDVKDLLLYIIAAKQGRLPMASGVF